MNCKLDRLNNEQKSTFLTVNCGGCVGGDCFLLKCSSVNILVDSGFAFCAQAMTEKIKARLKGETLDYVLLTHSHYDHAMGVPALRKAFPDVRIIGSEYCDYILRKPTARKKMQEMDDFAAKAYKQSPSRDMTDLLFCDITLKDGEEVNLNGVKIRAVSLPGHTRCCMGYFFTEEKMLVSCETLGICADESMVFPGCLIGYRITLDSLEKALKLDAKEILIPHSGYLYGEDIAEYLRASIKATDDCKMLIINAHNQGEDFNGIVEEYKEKYYSDKIALSYPEHALMANLSAQVPMFINECSCNDR